MFGFEVCEMRGRCLVYNGVGDRIIIEYPRMVLDRADALCKHALSYLLYYSLVLDRGASGVDLVLAKPKDGSCAYVQCVDPGEPYTGGGTVVFRIRRVSGYRRLKTKVRDRTERVQA